MMRENTESVPFFSYLSSWEITHYQDNCPTLRVQENNLLLLSFLLSRETGKEVGHSLLKNIVLRNKIFEYWGEANFGQLWLAFTAKVGWEA